MNTNPTQERVWLNEKEEGRELAMEETLALRDCYEGKPYIFEYGGKDITAEFITAGLQTTAQATNGYRIELLATSQTFADGECVITDIHGQKIDALAVTTRGKDQNLITIEIIASKSKGRVNS
jgi:hypothetical protein